MPPQCSLYHFDLLPTVPLDYKYCKMFHVSSTGSLSIKHEYLYYTLFFKKNGWMAADIIQYLDDILVAGDQKIAILKLLGYTLEIAQKYPTRTANHWVEVDLEQHILSTNSDLIRKAVDQCSPDLEDPYNPNALHRLHQVLDQHNFTVELVK